MRRAGMAAVILTLSVVGASPARAAGDVDAAQAKANRAARAGRWRIRLLGGGSATFAADSVLAVTPVRRRGRR